MWRVTAAPALVAVGIGWVLAGADVGNLDDEGGRGVVTSRPTVEPVALQSADKDASTSIVSTSTQGKARVVHGCQSGAGTAGLCG